MSRFPSDRWLWISYGIVMYCAVRGLQYAFQDMKEITKLEPEPEKKKPPKPLEHTVDLTTLRTLIDSPNLNISNAAISIVCQRVIDEDPGYTRLIKDGASPDPEVSRKAVLASAYLRDVFYEEVSRQHGNRPAGFGLDSIASSHTDDSMPDLHALVEGERLPLLEGGDVGNESLEGWTSVPRPSLADDEESQRRRRRREAVVYHEGEGAIAEADIFRRAGNEDRARPR